jgi:hypothetical protein
VSTEVSAAHLRPCHARLLRGSRTIILTFIIVPILHPAVESSLTFGLLQLRGGAQAGPGRLEMGYSRMNARVGWVARKFNKFKTWNLEFKNDAWPKFRRACYQAKGEQCQIQSGLSWPMIIQ